MRLTFASPLLRATLLSVALLSACAGNDDATPDSGTTPDTGTSDMTTQPDTGTSDMTTQPDTGTSDMTTQPDTGTSDMATTDMETETDIGADAAPDMETETDMGADADEDADPDMEVDPCIGLGPDVVCVDGDTQHVYNTDLCGKASTVNTTCAPATACEVHSDGQAYCACPLTGETTCVYPGVKSSLYEPSMAIRERSCANLRVEPLDVLEDCEWGSMCFQDPAINNNVALCHRSIDVSQSTAPYYNFGCSQFSMWMRTPTGLEIDCRCRDVGDGQGGTGGTGSAFADPNNIDITMGARPGGPIINCLQSTTQENGVWPIDYGTGPSFNAWKQQNNSGASWFSGAVDPVTREMYSIIKWTNPQHVKSASIVAWNLDTKNRRIITGLYPDPQAGQVEFGSGYSSPQPNNVMPLQPLTGANVLRIGPDSMIYTYGGGTGESTDDQREIVRTDPATGERTLIWKAQNSHTGDITATYGQCFRPDALGTMQSVGLNSQSFEIGPDGKFYMGFRGAREGDGIIEISADGTTCSFLTRWGGLGHNPGGGITPAPGPAQIGTGFVLQFPVQGLLFHDGLVFGVSNDELYSFEPATGNRLRRSYTNGTYGGMGFSNMFWDPTRNVVWAVGTAAAYVGTIVDLTTGRRESIYGDTGLQEYGAQAILVSDYGTAQSVGMGTMLSNGHSINYGGVILDPADNNIVYAVLKTGGLMKMELNTFNNYVHSW